MWNSAYTRFQLRLHIPSSNLSLVAGLSAVWLAAQPAPPNPAPISLDVAAVDRSGQPVSGLRAEDFQILDEGKPQKAAWAHRLAAQANPIGMGRHSNRSATASPSTVVLLDLFNRDLSRFNREIGARQLCARIAGAFEKLRSDDHVYLYVLTPQVTIVAVRGSAGGSADAIRPILEEVLRKVMQPRPDYIPLRARIAPTWTALSQAVMQMAEIPGPKSFVWITQGVPYRQPQFGMHGFYDADPLAAFAASLNAIEGAAYSVVEPVQSLAPIGSGAAIMDTGRDPGSPLDTLDHLGALTGGRVYSGDDETGKAILQAANDARKRNYRIAFLPRSADGRYHKIRVTASRKNVEVLTADHYYAVQDLDAARRQEVIAGAAGASRFEYPEIGLTATLSPAEGKAGEFRFTMFLNPANLALVEDGQRYKDSVAVWLFEIGANGERTMISGTPVDLDLSNQEYANALHGGVKVTEQATLRDTARQIRLVVLDCRSQLAGTLTIPLDHRPH